MNIAYIVIGALLAYLVGAIPTSLWYGKAFFNIDIREEGSGNAGATNTFRVMGKKAGSFVLAIDILKGFVASSLADFLFFAEIIPAERLFVFKMIFGVLAVIGHIFPVYANFRGGKGVAALFGIALALNLPVALVCLAIFLVTVIVTKYVSLGSMVGTFMFPLLNIVGPFRIQEPVVWVFGITIFGIVVFTHQKNIKRLLHGEENKSYLFKKSRS